MSVNTPKRPKTAYHPGLASESPLHHGQSSSTIFCPSRTNVWDSYSCLARPCESGSCPPDQCDPRTCAPSQMSTPAPTTSPSSSCGSPEMTNPMNAVLRTPSTTTTTKEDMQQFPTPTTSSLLDYSMLMGSGGREHKRGRPRSESLTNLMIEGSTSPSAIKCKFCNRVFPREKSLAAHLRTHTGERPYVCDYPGCTKSFTQSGQMKTHQRLHTGERPFICAVPACEMRFTHANRHCPVHVNAVLKRDDKFVVKMTPEQNQEVLSWLEKYRAEREDKSTPTRKTPQRSRLTPGGSAGKGKGSPLIPSSSNSMGNNSSEDHHHQRGDIGGEGLITINNHNPHTPIQDRTNSNIKSCYPESSSSYSQVITNSSSRGGSPLKRHPPPMMNDENECPLTPTTPSKRDNNPYKSRKGLMVELDMNAGLAMSPLAPLKMKPQPKHIQWQEPLSQEEDEDEEENDYQENNNKNRNYYQQQFNERSPQKKAQQLLKLTPSKRESKENRNYNSPSKKGVRKEGNSSSTFNPKKKWLREACMEDLAKPLDQTPVTNGVEGVLGSPQKLQIKSMNLLRPTVLMLASSREKPVPILNNGHNAIISGQGVVSGGGEGNQVQALNSVSVSNIYNNINNNSHPPEMENNRRWLGKMALMQLATEEAQAVASMRGRTIISEVVGESVESVSSSTEVESVHNNNVSYKRPEQEHQQYVVSSNLGPGIVTANHHHLLLPEYTQL